MFSTYILNKSEITSITDYKKIKKIELGCHGSPGKNATSEGI